MANRESITPKTPNSVKHDELTFGDFTNKKWLFVNIRN